MGNMLEALYRLQDVELKLAEWRRAREIKTRRVDLHSRHVKKAEERVEQCQISVRERQVRLDALQLDVAAREEVINTHRQALNKAKTNKEYAAILTAMNTEKADSAKLETEILLLMEALQGLQSQAETIEAEKAKTLQDAARAEKLLSAYDAETKEDRDRLEADRERCSEGLPPTTLATFNRVAVHHDGEAMAPVTKTHPKRDEWACSGCNMNIALEVVNTLKIRDDLQVCKVCGRILCLEPPSAERSRA